MPSPVAQFTGQATKEEVLGIIKNLKKSHTVLDRFAEAETDQFFKSIRRAQSYLYRRVSEILAESQFNPNWDYTAKLKWYTENWAAIERVAITEAAQVGGGRYAYTYAVAQYGEGYGELAKMAENMLAAGLPRVSGEFTRLPKQWIEFIKRRDLAWFDFLGDEAIRKLDETVLWNVLAGRSPGGLLQELKGVITGSYPWGNKRGLYEWHAGTYARTAHRRAVATWKNEKAKELGLDWRVYIGPIDSKAREFCLELVGGSFTVQEIEQMDNGQTGNVLVDRGGWNCRHDWDPIDTNIGEVIREDPEIGLAIREELRIAA